MSNAMRFGKRSLAGVAAVGLAAALIPFVGAGPAAADTASIVLNQAGVNVVKTSGNDTTAFRLVAINVGSDGLAQNIDTATETISATVTGWPGGGAYSQTANINLQSTAVATRAQAAIPQPTGLPGYYTFWFTGNNQATGWANASLTSGTYTVTVAVTNLTTGASVTKSLPIVVTTNEIEPLGSAAWVDPRTGSAYNSLSGPSGAAVGSITATARLRDSNGYALILDTAKVTGSLTTAIGTGPSTATTTTGGYASTTSLGYYTFTPTGGGGGTWGTGGSNAFNLNYATVPAVESSIPVTIASNTAAVTATSTTLTTTPQIIPAALNDCVNASACEYAVPSGTSSLTFTNTTAQASGTIAWSTESTGGAVTSSAGVAAISAVSGGGAYGVSIGVSADASADDEAIAFTTGGRTTDVIFQDPTPTVDAPTPVVAKLGSAVAIAGTVTDQWGRNLAGTTLVSVTNFAGTVVYDSKTSADGKFSLSVPASASPVSAGNVTYVVRATNGAENSNSPVVVTYNSTGEITSLTLGSNPAAVSGQVPALLVPGSGQFDASVTGISTAIVNPLTAASTAPSGTGSVAVMTPTATPATSVTLTGTDGVFFTTSVSTTAAWNVGSASLTVPSGTAVRVYTTKAGKGTVTASAGGKTATVDVYGYTQIANARNLALSPEKLELKPNSFSTVKMTVTDVFGNPVFNVPVVAGTPAAGQVGVSIAGAPTLQATGNTTAAGEFNITVASTLATGDALLTAVGAGNQFNTTILGASVSKYIAQATVVVKEAATKTILIVGERGTVSGKSGIIVDGTVTGIDNGKTVTPFIRFPGETSFTAGSARPVITGGEFTWQRKTGKRVTVYVTSEGATSNRVTIQAN